MSNVSVRGFSISLDGYGAGRDQSVENPIGIGGEQLHDWMVKTRSFGALQGEQGGETGVDDDFVARSFENVGAWIMGRNMFGPVRGAWPDELWRGWWGDNPPFHVPIFVLTHHPRKSLTMEGGNVFHFVSGGIDAALEQARDAAGTKDVRIGGGISTVRQYLAAGLVDDVQLAVAPILLGKGEHLFAGLDLPALGYRLVRRVPSERAVHLLIERG